MKKVFQNLRDTVIAGILFLLPFLILFVLISKVFQFFNSFTTKIANLFGLPSIAGISSSTIIGTLGFIALCLLCGYLVRIAYFKQIRKWIDEKLRSLIPGYELYHEMAVAKLVNQEEALPYEMAVWVKRGDVMQPGFLMETMPDGKPVVFFPSAGDVKNGLVVIVDSSAIKRCPGIDMKQFKLALSNLGLGISKLG